MSWFDIRRLRTGSLIDTVVGMLTQSAARLLAGMRNSRDVMSMFPIATLSSTNLTNTITSARKILDEIII
jgi:hypothetical protein